MGSNVEFGETNSMELSHNNPLQKLIASLHEAFESDQVNVEHVEKLMGSYESNPKDWEKFALFDQQRYTRNLVDAGNGKFNLLLVCWLKGHRSAVHDHADSHCFMRILDGAVNEVRFAWPANEKEVLRETSKVVLNEKDVSYMNDSLGLHLLEIGEDQERAVSLHLYSPPFDTCSLFDKKTGHRTKCQVTFWSKYGEKTGDVEDTSEKLRAIPKPEYA